MKKQLSFKKCIAVFLVCFMIFTTLSIAFTSISADEEKTNIALGKSVTGATYYADLPDYAPGQIVDGDVGGTRWNSKGLAESSGSGGVWSGVEELIIDLGDNYRIDSIDIRWNVGNRPGNHTIEVSKDGTDYTQVASFDSYPEEFQNYTFENAEGRYIRLALSVPESENFGYSIWELAAYGEEVSDQPAKTNIALGKTVTGASYYADNDFYAPGQIVDGNVGETRWNSKGLAESSGSGGVWSGVEELIIDLGANYRIDSIDIRWNVGNRPGNHTIEVSKDGTDYTQVASFDSYPEEFQNYTFENAEGRYIRLTLSVPESENFGYSIWEFQAFGEEVAETDDPGTTPDDPGTTPDDPGTTPDDPMVKPTGDSTAVIIAVIVSLSCLAAVTLKARKKH